MAEMNIAERRLLQDGRIRVTLRGRRVDIRTSTIPTVHGESIVMRLLDRQSVFLPLEKPGFAPAMLPRFEASSGGRTGSSSSPGRPDPARRPRSTGRSTRSTRPTARSSPSRIRSNIS